jgi:hypothetical protein
MEQVANEMLYGNITHYTIGVGLAVTYVLGWDLLGYAAQTFGCLGRFCSGRFVWPITTSENNPQMWLDFRPVLHYNLME